MGCLPLHFESGCRGPRFGDTDDSIHQDNNLSLLKVTERCEFVGLAAVLKMSIL